MLGACLLVILESVELRRANHLDAYVDFIYSLCVTAPKRHVGPGKKVVSLYVDAGDYERVKAKAKALRMSASKYLFELARKDAGTSNPLLIEPSSPASGSVEANTVAVLKRARSKSGARS